MKIFRKEDKKENRDMFEISKSLRESIIQIISDKQTLVDIVLLLAFIRNIIKDKKQKTISLNIGYNKIGDMSFSVNGEQIANYIAKDNISIN